MNVGLRIYKVFRLLLVFAVFAVAMACLHELGHHIAAYYLGVAIESPQITMIGWWAGYYDAPTVDHNTFVIIAYSGGFFVAALYGILWAVCRFNRTLWDSAIEFVTGFIAAIQLGAGFAEGYYFWRVREGFMSRAHYEQESAIMMTGFGALMLFYGAWRWAHFFKDDNAR